MTSGVQMPLSSRRRGGFTVRRLSRRFIWTNAWITGLTITTIAGGRVSIVAPLSPLVAATGSAVLPSPWDSDVTLMATKGHFSVTTGHSAIYAVGIGVDSIEAIGVFGGATDSLNSLLASIGSPPGFARGDWQTYNSATVGPGGGVSGINQAIGTENSISFDMPLMSKTKRKLKGGEEAVYFRHTVVGDTVFTYGYHLNVNCLYMTGH